MYCTFCGTQIADDDAFCLNCGKPTQQSEYFARLVAAARNGNQNAISALYEKTYSKVYYTVKSMIKDEDAVFDIVQDTYIKAFTNLNSFQGDTKFLAWVRQVAANTARDWLKKRRPMLFTELRSDDDQDTPVEELFPDERSEHLPDQVIDLKETKRLINEILEELPEDQHAVIGMFYYEEMSVKEIAAAMGVSESAVKSRLMYGRNKIEKKVLELEKKGTKLYGLAPLPFLLLLFHNQKVYAAEVPNGQILHNILASQPVDAATAGTAAGGKATGTAATEAAAGTEAAGAAAAGTAAAAAVVGLGALKIGLITLGTVAVVGLGAFGVTRIVSGLVENREASSPEDAIVREEATISEDATETEAETSEESEALKESTTQEEADPIGEALEQYRIIIGQADSYTYSEDETNVPWRVFAGYRYALVQMQPDDPVPTLLLEKEDMDTEQSISIGDIRVFQYDPDTKTVRQPTETIRIGELRSSFGMARDGNGILSMGWGSVSWEGSATRITLDGDTLKREVCWTGRIDQRPDSITFIEIEWHEIEDLSALDSWTAPAPNETDPSESVDNNTLPTDGDRIVLTGTVKLCSYDEIIALQGEPDPNVEVYDEDYAEDGRLIKSRA